MTPVVIVNAIRDNGAFNTVRQIKFQGRRNPHTNEVGDGWLVVRL